MTPDECALAVRDSVVRVVGEAGDLGVTRVSTASATDAPGADHDYSEVTTDG